MTETYTNNTQYQGKQLKPCVSNRQLKGYLRGWCSEVYPSSKHRNHRKLLELMAGVSLPDRDYTCYYQRERLAKELFQYQIDIRPSFDLHGEYRDPMRNAKRSVTRLLNKVKADGYIEEVMVEVVEGKNGGMLQGKKYYRLTSY